MASTSVVPRLQNHINFAIPLPARALSEEDEDEDENENENEQVLQYAE
jgi:hypothetical protein